MTLRFTARCMALIMVMVLALPPSMFAQANNGQEARTQLQALGKGKRVVVYFRDGTAEEGKIAALEADGFVLAQSDGKGRNSFLYVNVLQAKKAPMRENSQRNFLIALFVGVAVAITVVAIALAHRSHTLTPPPMPV